MTLLKTGAEVHCPHCNTKQEDPVENYTIPGRMGADSRAGDSCYECGGNFYVEQVSENTFELTV